MWGEWEGGGGGGGLRGFGKVWEGQEDSTEGIDAHGIYNKCNTVLIFLNDLANINRQILEIIFNFCTCISCKIDIATNMSLLSISMNAMYMYVIIFVIDHYTIHYQIAWPHILTFISVTVIFLKEYACRRNKDK